MNRVFRFVAFAGLVIFAVLVWVFIIAGITMPAQAQVPSGSGAKPGTCGAGQFVNGIYSTKTPTCATPAGAGDVTAVNITTTSPVTGGANCASGSCSFTLGLSVTPANDGGAVALQDATPGTQQTGHFNLSGTAKAATFSGDLNGTINTATTAATQTANDNSTKVATTAYVDALGDGALPSLSPGGRLTLTTGVPVTPTDVTAALVLYYTPYVSGQIPLYYAGAWRWYALSEKSLKLTDSAQTGTMTSGTAVITGLTSTVGLVVGMEITGTSVGVGSVIVSVDSLTQVTGSVNSTGSTTNAVTFKLPANTLYDVVAVPTSASAFHLQFLSAWSNSGAGTSARTIAITYANAQNGVLVNDTAYAAGQYNTIAAKAARWLGTVRTTATAGQTEDSFTNRLVGNFYNVEPRSILINPGYTDNNASTSYTTTSTTWVAANSGTGATGAFVAPHTRGGSVWTLSSLSNPSDSSANACLAGIGWNSTTSAASLTQMQAAAAFGSYPASSSISLMPTVGYNTVSLLIARGAANCTYYADSGRGAGDAADPRITTITGVVNN